MSVEEYRDFVESRMAVERGKRTVRKKRGTKKAAPPAKKKTKKVAKKKTSRKKSPLLKRIGPKAGLKASELSRTIVPGRFPFGSTAELEPLNDIVGQDRALKALSLGVRLGASGYNIYVSGVAGTGKTSTVRRLLDQIRPNCPMLKDYIYVYNFHVPNEPMLITLPAKMGRVFAGKMERLLQVVREEIPSTLEGEGIL